MIRIGCVLLPAVSVGMFMVWEKPVALVFVGAVAQGLMLPFLGIAALYFRYQRTDAPLRPGNMWTCCLWLSALGMFAAGVFSVLKELGILK